MTFSVIAPVSGFIGVIWNMTHQIKIVYSMHNRDLTHEQIKEKLELLYMPRLLYSIYTCAVYMLFGLEISNCWMFFCSAIGLILTLILTGIIWSVTKKAKSR